MKKYLMGGIAAVAICAAFTSCSKNNELFDQNAAEQAKQQEQVNKMNENYEKAFINTFGKPSSTHTWGFGATKASTRVNAGENYKETSTGINANANQWADKANASHGFGGWVVPDPLTDTQKAVVAAYFQANPDLDYDDPEWRHFFVQQVYKGGKTTVGNTTEGIIAADGSSYSSDNMNLLTVGANNQHINNFNAGNCSVNNNVLSNGGNTNDGPFHSDQIMLMVNIDDTSCMGYHETGSSTHHNDKAALVDWETIRTWANANGLDGDCLNDGWDRSFVGFDLAIKEGEQAYEKDNNGNVIYATYNQAAESPKYAWDGEKIIEIAEQSQATGWQVVYKEGYENIQNLGWLTSNKNFYVAADQVTMPQTISMNRAQASTITTIQNAPVLKDIMVDNTYYQSVINLPRINQLVADGYVPVNNKNLTEWVQVGTSDGYFSDWIVTLTKAERQSEYQGRIMAEDLNAVEESDFDFNDVVFDWKIEGNVATIQLRAAGGIYPLYVGDQEVHAKFGQSASAGKYPMINTGAGVTASAEPYTYTFPEGTEAKAVNIPIYVIKDGSTKAYLNASTGKAASKFNTKTTTRWVKEFEDILDAYPDFKGWVANEDLDWTTNKNLDYIY